MAGQRGQVVMSEKELADFIATSRTATFATIGPTGTPHVVAMWYAYLDGVLWIETRPKSQKALNLRRDPRLACCIERGDTYGELRGVALEGTGVFVEDPETLRRVCLNIIERYDGIDNDNVEDQIERIRRNRVFVRLDVTRWRSWDHRKLGLPTSEPAGSTAQFLSLFTPFQ